MGGETSSRDLQAVFEKGGERARGVCCGPRARSSTARTPPPSSFQSRSGRVFGSMESDDVPSSDVPSPSDGPPISVQSARRPNTSR